MRAFEAAYHSPVLASETVALLRHAKSVLDGTLGGGGHAHALLESGVPLVVGVDRDPEALAVARVRLEAFERTGRFRAVLANYADIDTAPELRGLEFDGILLDLGVSSRQLDALERGFTFREEAPLDMRMSGAGDGDTAADILNALDERRLAGLFTAYADEPRAGRLAREIVRRRAKQPFRTSDDLVRAIRGALGVRSGPADFARIFQALRIAVNDELEGLARALPALRERLGPEGTLAVITYHSGEDRVVKHAFREWSSKCICPPKQPVCTCRGHALGSTLTRKAVSPTDAEIAYNPRSRSAKLRAWRKDGEEGSGKRE
jgi:16S rRNA (cytosine1402-N4)-methyltransferase